MKTNPEEPLIQVFLSGKKIQEIPERNHWLRKIGHSASSGGGLLSLGSKRAFVREQAARYRRCVVKAFVSKNKNARWMGKRQGYVDYIQREGVGKDGEKGILYGADSDLVNVQNFIQRGQKDAHEFRFILSPEDADQINLTEFTRSVLGSLEKDFGTQLDWVASNHYNTDDPHTHIVLRGIDENGNALILDRDTISHGIRNRAREILTRELGERTDLEIQKEIELSVTKNRATPIDSEIEKKLSTSHTFTLREDLQFQEVKISQDCQEQRLLFLSNLGLSEKIDLERWRLQPDFFKQLKELGAQGDIIHRMHRELKVDRADCVIYPKEIHGQSELKGLVVKRGICDEITDQNFLVVEDENKRYYYVDLDRSSERSKVKEGDRVKISLAKPKISVEATKPRLETKTEQSIQQGLKMG